MAKVNEKAKVEALESAVIAQDPVQVRQVFETYGSIEFTARSLGIACLYGDVETVKELASRGVTFRYSKEAEQKYKIQMKTYSDTYSPDYCLMLGWTQDTFWDPYHYGMLPELPESKNAMDARMEMLNFLLEDPDRYGMDLPKLLYYAILWRNRELAAALMDRGISLADEQIRWLEKTNQCWHRGELTHAIRNMEEEELLYILNTYASLLESSGKKVALTHGMVEYEGFGIKSVNQNLLQPSVIRFMLDKSDFKKIQKGELMELLVREDNIPSLELLANAGWLKTTAQLDRLLECAQTEEKTTMAAWLMDYRARTTSPEKEQAKEEARVRRALSPAVSPTAALKKLWNFNKRDDGNLELTGYKGSETVIHVPAVIGKDAVTVIGSFTLCPMAHRIRNYSERNAITQIFIPEGIRMVDHVAFGGIRALTDVYLPASVRFIGSENFDRSNITIHAPAGSYAESFARKHNIPFTVTTGGEDNG